MGRRTRNSQMLPAFSWVLFSLRRTVKACSEPESRIPEYHRISRNNWNGERKRGHDRTVQVLLDCSFEYGTWQEMS